MATPITEVSIVESLDTADKKELDAVFTISSAKPGNGVEQLRDNNTETYWWENEYSNGLLKSVQESLMSV